jgi:hypothetical protein
MPSEIEQLRVQVDELRRELSRQVARHDRYPIIGSGNCHTIRFEIVSSDPDTRTALVLIQARPVGCSEVPDSSLEGTAVEVCDPQGCFFNEPTEEMTGRHGWAEYMKPTVENICQSDIYALENQWEVFSLCCPLSECT